jgi:subtilisin family serine protease
VANIYDVLHDVPVYGGPTVTLPKDLDRSKDQVMQLNKPRLWHWLPELAEAMSKIATGRGIRIAVLDTGYTKHPDGPDPIASKSFIRGESITDGNGHGTHVAGSALGRNGIGIAPGAELIVGKVLSNEGSGASDGIAAGIRWAAEQGADIINMSLGGGGSYAPTNQAIDYAVSLGCIVHVSAGNSGFSGNGNTIGWPARHRGCIANGAYRADGQIANFSSGGAELDWACPGEAIVSFSNTGSGYRTMSGTSMSAPIGTGALACVQEVLRREGGKRWKSADAVRAFLKANLKDAGTPGWDPRFGNGIPVFDMFVSGMMNKELVWA